MQANHYPLSPTIQLCQSTYGHAKPGDDAVYLRPLGLDAAHEKGKVGVYYATAVELDANRSPADLAP